MIRRPTVENVKITVAASANREAAVTLPGGEYEAVFFNDRAVSGILAPFYGRRQRYISREEMSTHWGGHALPLMENRRQARVTPALVEQLWNPGDPSEFLPPFLPKSKKCIPVITKNLGMEIGPAGERPRVTGITLQLVFPGGRTASVPVDPATTEALCWSDRAVSEILAPFYDSYESLLTPGKLVEETAFHMLPLLKGQTYRAVSPALVEELWYPVTAGDPAPPFIRKSKRCIPVVPLPAWELPFMDKAA